MPCIIVRMKNTLCLKATKRHRLPFRLIIANANLIGNGIHLYSVGISARIIGIRGSNTSPWNMPFIMYGDRKRFQKTYYVNNNDGHQGDTKPEMLKLKVFLGVFF